MKALFLIFHGLNPANGISKKIYYQVNALRACGIDTRLCYLNESNGRKLRMIDSEVLQDYGAGFKGKILKRIEYSSIVEYAKKENISFIYMRSDHNANPFIIRKTKCFDLWERNVLFPKTKRSFFRTPTLPFSA